MQVDKEKFHVRGQAAFVNLFINTKKKRKLSLGFSYRTIDHNTTPEKLSSKFTSKMLCQALCN